MGKAATTLCCAAGNYRLSADHLPPERGLGAATRYLMLTGLIGQFGLVKECLYGGRILVSANLKVSQHVRSSDVDTFIECSVDVWTTSWFCSAEGVST